MLLGGRAGKGVAAEVKAGFLLRALTAAGAPVGVVGGGGALALGACFGVAATVWAYVRVAALVAALVTAGAILRAAEATCRAWLAPDLTLRVIVWMSWSFLGCAN